MVQEIIPVQYNFKLINFTSIFNRITGDVLDSLYSLGLLDKDKISIDIKRVFLHHTIKEICDTCINRHRKTPVVIYYYDGECNSDLHIKYGYDIVNSWLLKTLHVIAKILPIRIYFGNVPFEYALEQINNKSGEGAEILINIKSYVDNYNTDEYLFSKVKLYAKRHGLQFLDKEYFSRIKAKHLLFA